jgi:hypothetical protein
MTTLTIKAVGFCVNYTEQGDRAFALALDIAKRNLLQLNVFHFLEDPYQAGKAVHGEMAEAKRTQKLVDMERRMRLYYDERLGDYLDVGFRLCERNEWTELHRCLSRREFQTLILACPSADASFAQKPLTEFAGSFLCPVIVVGPEPHQLRFNPPSRLVLDQLFGKSPPALEEIA